MPTADIARFGVCSHSKSDHTLEKRVVGVDDQYGEVSTFRCTRCGRCWLHYFIEYEHLSAADRWLEGEISPAVAASLTPNEAVPLFDQMESFFCSGSAYGGKLRRVTGPAKTWLTPFPGPSSPS